MESIKAIMLLQSLQINYILIYLHDQILLSHQLIDLFINKAKWRRAHRNSEQFQPLRLKKLETPHCPRLIHPALHSWCEKLKCTLIIQTVMV